MFEQKYCFAPKIFEQNISFASKIFEQKSCFAPKLFEQNAFFAPKMFQQMHSTLVSYDVQYVDTIQNTAVSPWQCQA